jgi:4-carboxymuconolactone decarboxylase
MKTRVLAKCSAFTTMRDDGALLGPWNAWLHDPELGKAFWTVTEALTHTRRIPDPARQIDILVVGSRFGADYEIYAHSAVARTAHNTLAAEIAAMTDADVLLRSSSLNQL